MRVLLENWRRILFAAVLALISRVLMLKLLPLSPTFEFPLSPISRAIGMIPTAGSVVAVCYLAIAAILVFLQPRMAEDKLSRAISCTLSFSFVWFVGVLEIVPAVGMAFVPELKVAVADVVPIIVLGIAIGIGTPLGHGGRRIRHPFRNASVAATIAAVYVVARYFLYSVVHVNSGYSVRETATFAWTLAMGLAIGTMYLFLRESLSGKNPREKGLYFGFVIFGIVWMLFNFFMPIVFDISFIKFDPPILHYVWKVTVDILAVTVGVWLAESVSAEGQRKPEKFLATTG